MPEQPTLRVAGTPEPAVTSESEEMYLITVARAIEEGTPEPVPVAAVAEALSVSAGSANEMIKKLAERDLVGYEPYRGVRLSDTGRVIANRVLRSRRLWATFLADHLGFGPTEADDQACHLEHVTEARAAERLAAFLGEPEADPLGRPIPTPGDVARKPANEAVLPSDVPIGHVAEVVSITASRPSASFLEAEGILVGATLVVLGAGKSGMLVRADDTAVHLGPALVESIRVRDRGAADATG